MLVKIFVVAINNDLVEFSLFAFFAPICNSDSSNSARDCLIINISGRIYRNYFTGCFKSFEAQETEKYSKLNKYIIKKFIS